MITPDTITTVVFSPASRRNGRILMNTSTVFFRLSVSVLLCCVGALPVQSQNPLGSDPIQQQEAKKPADATPNKAEVPAKQKTLSDKLAELEVEFDQLSQTASYGLSEIREIAKELEDEYRKNQEELKALDEPNAALRERQETILLYLWELQRVGPTLRNSADLLKRLSALTREHRDELRDSAVMRRYGELSQRIYKMESDRRSAEKNFHLVPPGETISSPKPASSNPFQAPAWQIPGGVDEGKLVSGLRSPLRYLFKLRYDDGKLVLDRDHWDAPFAAKSMEQISEEVTELLNQHGVFAPQADAQGRAGAGTRSRPHVVMLFENLEYYAKKLTSGGGSSGGGGTNDRWVRQFTRDGINAKLRHTANSLQLDLHVGSSLLHVLQPDEQSLKITLVVDGAVTRFEQKPDGSVRFIGVQGDKAVSISAESFAELCATSARGQRPAVYRIGQNRICLADGSAATRCRQVSGLPKNPVEIRFHSVSARGEAGDRVLD